MVIWIDADAAPRDVKDIVCRVIVRAKAGQGGRITLTASGDALAEVITVINASR